MSAPWMRSACTLLQNAPALVRVTVARTRGSSPRETGATMLVTAQAQWNTIGGGHLEWQAVEKARHLLADPQSPAVQVEHLLLGPDLAQCCGGEVTLWMERIAAAERDELQALCEGMALHSRFEAGRVQRRSLPSVDESACMLGQRGGAPELVESLQCCGQALWIFGAGHVGQALMRMLQQLPLFDVRWVDGRPGIADGDPALAGAVTCVAQPCDLVAGAPRGTWWLVLTHDHELDFQLCTAILARNEPEWLGLIGSASKAARFRSRLRRSGHSAEAIARLDCPVGITAIRSKLPAAIAVGIAAQLLEKVTLDNALLSPATASPQGMTSMPGTAPTHRAPPPLHAAACEPACGRCTQRQPA